MVILAFAIRVSGIFLLRTYDIPRSSSEHSTTPPEFVFGKETGSIAGSLASGKGFSSPFGQPTGSTAWVAPIYPSLIALIFKIFGLYTNASAIAAYTLNSVFSALTCIPIVLIGQRTVGRVPAVLAGWLWACFPAFIRWPITWIWDMSLAAFLLAFLVLLTLKLTEQDNRTLWLGYGVLWALAALTNPAILSVLPLAIVWLAFKRIRSGRRVFMPLTLTIGAFLLCSSPWILRNTLVLGKPAFFRDNFWFELHLGNYRDSNGLGWGGRHPVLNQREMDLYKQLGEVQYIDYHRRLVMDFLRQHPERFVALTLYRIKVFWRGDADRFNYYPAYRDWESWAYVSVSILSLLGLILALDKRIFGAFLFGIVLFCYPVVYYVTYPGPRYRHVIEPEFLLLSTFVLNWLAQSAIEKFGVRHRKVRANSGASEP